MRKITAVVLLVSLFASSQPVLANTDNLSDPIVTATTGSGSYPFGTDEVELGIQTLNPAECRLSTGPDYPFGALYLDFISTDGLAHTYPLSTYDSGQFIYYAVCRDLQNGATSREPLRFDIEITQDTTPTNTTLAPAINYVSGKGPHAVGTASVTLAITTDIEANCRLAWNPGYDYGALYENFESSDGRNHYYTLDTYESRTQTYYTRCESVANGVANEVDFPLPVYFRDENDSDIPIGEEPQITLESETQFESSQASVAVVLSTDREARCRLSLSGPYDYDQLYTDLLTQDGLSHSYNLDTYGGGNITIFISCISEESQVINSEPFIVTIAMPEGVGDNEDSPSQGYEALMRNTEYQTPFIDNLSPVEIQENNREFVVESGDTRFRLSKKTLNLIAERDGVKLNKFFSSTVNLNGRRLKVEAPLEYDSGRNWIEFRGWFSLDNNLWYVARFRFWPDSPFVHLSFSLTDRHDNHPTEAHWDPLWSQREIQDFRVVLGGLTEHESQTVIQSNAFSGTDSHRDPRIIEQAAEGETHWRQTVRADGKIQLVHWAENSGKTFVKIKPNRTGAFNLTLKQDPLASPYPAANAVQVIVRHSHGRDSVIVDQGLSENSLGHYVMDENSWIKILASSEDESDRIVFGSLELTTDTMETESIAATRMPDHVLDTGEVGLVIKDFWKQFPVMARATGRALMVSAIRQPVNLVGGVGYTLDIGYNFNTSLVSSHNLSQRMIAAPEPSFPDWWSELDGVITKQGDYKELLNLTHGIIHTNDEVSGNYGWQNWGDYQIGPSYFYNSEPTENWGALQYDLGHGLLMAWMQTGDTYLWNRAHASIRSSMDIQIAKFEPYLQKRSGAGIRKGECSVNFHWCQENIPDFNYHTRSLLLYSHLTGEQWPKDIAQMLIDNSAYFAHTRREWLIETGSRPLAWALRNLVYGDKVFPQGSEYNESVEYGYPTMPQRSRYSDLLQVLVDDLVTLIEDTGFLPGDQPVWQAQILEGLIMAYESEALSSELKARTFEAIKTSMAYFDDNNIRSQNNANYEIVYDSTTSEWADAANYGWFWVNNYAWAGEHIDEKYTEKSALLISWLTEIYRSLEYQSTRAWSGVIGFPSYAVSLQQ